MPNPSAPSTPAPPGTFAEEQRLIEALQLHQLELEMQNEQLAATHLAAEAARAQAEAARAQAEAARAQFAALYDFAPAALFTVGTDGTIAQLNERAGRLLGTTAGQLSGRRLLLFVSPESRDAFLEFFGTVLSTRQRHAAEFVLQTAAGSRLVAHVDGVVGTNLAGAPAVQLAVMDITPLSEEVERRQRSDDRLNLALAASGTGVWVWAFATNALEWDAQAQACFGRPHDPSPTSFAVLQDAVHPTDVVLMQQALQATIRHGLPLDIEHRVLWPDGSVHYLAAHAKVQYDAQGRPECLVGLVRDVTERCLAEEALRYRNRQFQEFLQNLPVVFMRLSAAGECLELTGAGLHRLSLPDNSLQGRTVYEAFPALTEPMQRMLSGQPVSFLGSTDTPQQRVHFQNHGFFDEHSQQGVLFSIDVTESEQAKAQLCEEQKFTKSLLDHHVDCVAAFDHAGRLTAWNRAMQALTGRPEAEALGQDVFACLPFSRDSPPGHIVEHLLDAGTRRPRFQQAFSLDGPPRDFELTAIPLPNPKAADKSGGLLLLRDVTERNRLHATAASFKAQQQAETFRMILMAQEVERKRIAEALHNGVGQLLYATKLHLEKHGSAPTAATTTEALELLETAIKATRTVSFELTPGILEDFGLAVALQKLAKSVAPAKLLLSLYLTGLERPLPQVLTVAIYRMVQELLNNVIKHSRAEEATLHVAYEDNHVHISMEDDGGGFNVATAVGSAQGIGLAGLYNRAALLGGHFELVSRPGRGTIASLSLPVIQPEQNPT
ncbi:PAS domain S-box protein [Hymenobacter arizonensis]|uniref:histidine kinase n=1 Tax=Hymenobacter arizonensis TaxID=1227077 RepID=A0A1I5VDD9_HYMAR|nr:PAS domain S-box protein [Hymenobacter arizonensis]SFQ05490.1 PAS domain S-box-containing protein [Hymenobacter arizonensis]